MAKFSFKDPNPEKRLDALEAFIEYWVGPRSPEFGATDEQLEGLKIPAPLRRLYEFCFNWPAENSQQWGIPLLSAQNVLNKLTTTSTSYYEIPQGLLSFASENQGVTSWATLVEGADPPVYGLDYEWGTFYNSPDGQEHRRWTEISPSLTDFLIGFSLYELCMANNITQLTPLIEYIQTHSESVTQLTDNVHGHPAKISLFDEDILVFNWDWDKPDAWIFAARDDVALAKLKKFAGTITNINITTIMDSEDAERKWYVNLKADGSGSVSSSRTPKFLSQDSIPAGSMSIDEIVATVEPHLCSIQSGDCRSEARVNREVVESVMHRSKPPKSYLPNDKVKSLFQQAIAAIKNPSGELQVQLRNGSPLEW